MKNNLILYAAILTFGLVAPFVFPAFKVQLSILCVLIILSNLIALFTLSFCRDFVGLTNL